jgi:hypothetical protein
MPARRSLPSAPLMLAHLVKAGGAATNTRKATSLTLVPGYAHADGALVPAQDGSHRAGLAVSPVN